MSTPAREASLTAALHRQAQSQPAPAAPSPAAALRAQRSALTDQLMSMTIRKDLLNQQLRNSSGESADAIRAQIKQLDARVASTTAALDKLDEAGEKAALSNLSGTPAAPALPAMPSAAELSRMVRDAMGSVQGTGTGANARMDRLETMMLGLGALNGLGILLMAAVLWRSLRWPRMGRRTPAESAELEQLQRSIDVIAVEVERISEGQRFMSRALGGEGVVAPPSEVRR